MIRRTPVEPRPGTGSDGLMTTLLGGGCGIAEHLPESAHQDRVRRPTLGEREKVVDPESLCTTGSLAVPMGARMDPSMLHIKARSVGIEDQVPPVARVLGRAICDE